MQLPLNIHLSEINRFSNFIPGHNEELVDSIENNIASLKTNAKPMTELIFLWGGKGTGPSRLGKLARSANRPSRCTQRLRRAVGKGRAFEC